MSEMAHFIETGNDRARREGRRVFEFHGEQERMTVTIVSELDASPFADGSDFQADPNGPSNREAADALVGLASQLLQTPIGNRLHA
jgi:hypothetical protein